MIVQGLIGIRPLVLGHIHPGSTAQVLRTEILMLVLNCLLIMDPVSIYVIIMPCIVALLFWYIVCSPFHCFVLIQLGAMLLNSFLLSMKQQRLVLNS